MDLFLTEQCAQEPETIESEYSASITREPVTATLPRPTTRIPGEGEEEDGFNTVGRGGRTTQLTVEGIFKALQGVQEARGKKVSEDPLAV